MSSPIPSTKLILSSRTRGSNPESLDNLKTYRFEIVAEPGALPQVLETLCLDDAAAREAAELFALDAFSVALWQEARIVWASPPTAV